VARAGSLQRRLNEREKEMEADERDRQKEREELEDIRKKLLEDGHPDPEAEMERVNYANLFIIILGASLVAAFLTITTHFSIMWSVCLL